MTNQQKSDIKNKCGSIIGEALIRLSEFVVKIPCFGDWYEPVVPDQLRNKID